MQRNTKLIAAALVALGLSACATAQDKPWEKNPEHFVTPVIGTAPNGEGGEFVLLGTRDRVRCLQPNSSRFHWYSTPYPRGITGEFSRFGCWWIVGDQIHWRFDLMEGEGSFPMSLVVFRPIVADKLMEEIRRGLPR